jgi:hypothetical protein
MDGIGTAYMVLYMACLYGLKAPAKAPMALIPPCCHSVLLYADVIWFYGVKNHQDATFVPLLPKTNAAQLHSIEIPCEHFILTHFQIPPIEILQYI